MLIFSWVILQLKNHWRVIVPAILLLVIFIWIGLHQACKPAPAAKIDLDTVNRINNANEADRKAELQKTIEQNADVIKTVDQRNTIAETNEAERNTQIFVKVQEADAKIAAAKSSGRDVTEEELKCILIPENCK